MTEAEEEPRCLMAAARSELLGLPSSEALPGTPLYQLAVLWRLLVVL